MNTSQMSLYSAHADSLPSMVKDSQECFPPRVPRLYPSSQTFYETLFLLPQEYFFQPFGEIMSSHHYTQEETALFDVSPAIHEAGTHKKI